MPADKAVAGLRRYRGEESDRKKLSVLGVLSELLNQDGDITVSAVSRSAGVSREFIYSHDHLVAAVRKAAERSKQQRLDTPAYATSTHASRGYRADRSTLLDQIQKQKKKIAEQVVSLKESERYRRLWLGSQLPGAHVVDPEVHAELRIANERIKAETDSLSRRVLELQRLLAITQSELAASRQAHAEDRGSYLDDAQTVVAFDFTRSDRRQPTQGQPHT